MDVYLIRHAKAGSRSRYEGDDSERPLSDKGRAQADALAARLAAAGVTALLSMVSSCASGITVVGIDDGFGAACAVLRLLNGRSRHG